MGIKNKAKNKLSIIKWEAYEYFNHRRDWRWYAFMVAFTAILALLAWWATKDLVSVGAILLALFAGAIYTFKKPRRFECILNNLGLKIGRRFYEFGNFTSFSLIKENGLTALYLTASRRFVPPLTLYLPFWQSRRANRASCFQAYSLCAIQYAVHRSFDAVSAILKNFVHP